ncbi:hypothetical protein COHA_010573 [Chlorella ohadii]|uniref:Glucose-6-phosphate isomerase n=1 Tax=Chlorella ohadii TaxID=2649997 RepID=A0AAD5DDI4_9CHLO|nr:hypothetical protein COHA_010573 [Chlorella ohadii]
MDFSRQNATPDTVKLLLELAEAADLRGKVDALFSGKHINSTEDRAVLHPALRAPREAVIEDAGKNVVPEVWAVLDKIKAFTERVRSGEWKGVTGQPLTNVVSIGIGGSALGPLFVHTALSTEPEAMAQAAGRGLAFLANVDPVDAVRALHGLDAERTLVVIVSTNLKAVAEFGIDPENAFGFWDWVGGRFSVSSAVGMVPLSLHYSFPVMERFLQGMRAMDDHFRSAPLQDNLPALLGLLNVWNSTFLGHSTTAILPYQQALQHFAPHIQQLSMESNGKGVAIDGTRLPYETGEIDFGEPGTNGQHSFYQLIHQVSSHEELMCNFFAQPDALAMGKDAATLRAEGVPEHLVPHKTFTGNRPSLSILLPELNAFTLGQLLSLYEHRIATSGFVWGINSFDQWGVELGKVLANKVRAKVQEARSANRAVSAADGFCPSTVRLLNQFLEQGQTQAPAPGAGPSFPPGLKQ